MFYKQDYLKIMTILWPSLVQIQQGLTPESQKIFFPFKQLLTSTSMMEKFIYFDMLGLLSSFSLEFVLAYFSTFSYVSMVLI